MQYAVDDEGFRIPDFSYAGYRYGSGPLPVVPEVASSRLSRRAANVGTPTVDHTRRAQSSSASTPPYMRNTH